MTTVDPLLVAADRLTALAEAADDGPWQTNEYEDRVESANELSEVEVGVTYLFRRFIASTDSGMEDSPSQDASNAHFIATFDCSVARAVAELLRQIYLQHFEEIAGCCWTCSGEMNWPCVTYQAALAVATTLGAS